MILNKRTLIAWCFYDFASAAFPVIVTTFIFATYFTTHIAANEIKGTYQWANATALAGIIVAIASPIFGAIADHSGRHKAWLFFFTLLGVLSSGLLWYAYPNVSAVKFTLCCVVIGTIALEIAQVFYNSFLPHITPKDYIGRISGWAWGMGYIGGVLLLTIALFVFVKNPPTWLDVKTAEQVRICGPLVALWYGIFSLPLFFFVADLPGTGLSFYQAIKRGLIALGQTLRTLPQNKNLAIYLLAHMIYIDGLNTLCAFGGIYAAGTFKMPLSEVILFGLTMNISAGVGAIALAWIDDYFGAKPTILLSLMGLLVLGFLILIVQGSGLFWILGCLLSLFLGPVQAASRSLMARIIPEEKSTELFGIYAFSGRISSFIGPWLLGWATLYFQSQRAGMATILLFFIVGGSLMYFVRETT